MKPLSAQAAAALEAARQATGQFGPQDHAESGQVPVPTVYDPIRFSFDGMPHQSFPALSYGQLWNGWETPVVDKATMEQILTFSEQTFTWDGDTAVIENQEGEAEQYEPLPDGTYDLGYLGWTFRRARMCRQEGCTETMGDDTYDDWCAKHADWVFEHRRGGHAANPVADCPTCLDPDDC